MTLVHSFQVGALRCHTLEGGRQHLDGGAMFGVVPKALWERAAPPDLRNRIPLAMRCLLVEHPDGLVLIDTALGNKEDDHFRDIYGVENAGGHGGTLLEDALAEAGHRPEDIRIVLNTHLHFDHAGGNTRIVPAEPKEWQEGDPAFPGAPTAPVQLAFPNATYVVQRGELEFARHTNERTRASYLPHNFEPVANADRWRLLNGDVDVVPGITVRLTPGHVPSHQSVVIRDGGETAIFLGDIIPTAAHLKLPWIMGYDLEPLRSLESKRSLLREATAGGWRLIFEHDPTIAWGQATGGIKSVTLSDIVLAG